MNMHTYNNYTLHIMNTINLYIYIYIHIVCVFNIFHLKCIFKKIAVPIIEGQKGKVI